MRMCTLKKVRKLCQGAPAPMKTTLDMRLSCLGDRPHSHAACGS